jgi:hypothetical protein
MEEQNTPSGETPVLGTSPSIQEDSQENGQHDDETLLVAEDPLLKRGLKPQPVSTENDESETEITVVEPPVSAKKKERDLMTQIASGEWMYARR